MGKTDNIRLELQQCCSSAIRSRIFQVERDKLTIITEADLLTAIKLACVNKVSKTTDRNPGVFLRIFGWGGNASPPRGGVMGGILARLGGIARKRFTTQ